MKILITTDLFAPTVNGVVTSVQNLRAELEKQGHQVRILTISESHKSYQEGNVWYLGSVPSGIYPGVRIPIFREGDWIKELISWKPDVVHSQCEFCTFSCGKRIAWETGAVFVHTCHTLYEQYTQYLPLGKRLGRTALAHWMHWRLQNVDVLIAPTEKVEGALRAYGLENEIAVVPTGICLERFSEKIKPDEEERLRKECGLKQNTKIVLSLGRLGFEKRVDRLLEYWKQSETEDAELLIVGDGPARESLEELCEKLGLQERVHFFGMAAPEQVQTFYGIADLFVCASTSETQGLTYAEAAASGLPLLCQEDSCLEGVLKPGKNGFTFQNAEDFRQSLTRLLTEETGGFRQCSRKLARSFGTEVFGRNIAALYEKVQKKREMQREQEAQMHESIVV